MVSSVNEGAESTITIFNQHNCVGKLDWSLFLLFVLRNHPHVQYSTRLQTERYLYCFDFSLFFGGRQKSNMAMASSVLIRNLILNDHSQWAMFKFELSNLATNMDSKWERLAFFEQAYLTSRRASDMDYQQRVGILCWKPTPDHHNFLWTSDRACRWRFIFVRCDTRFSCSNIDRTCTLSSGSQYLHTHCLMTVFIERRPIVRTSRYDDVDAARLVDWPHL
jgi:hypothetical protein